MPTPNSFPLVTCSARVLNGDNLVRSNALNLHASLRGLIIFIRRTDETGHVHLLGQRLAVSPNWPHRLVRCEVDFDHHCIRYFGLRRSAPSEQPLLATIPYHRPDKPFQGEL